MASVKFFVLVTRPHHQADGLCQLIEAQGWQAIGFPMLEIHELEPENSSMIDDYDVLLFVSQNAVNSILSHCSIEQLQRKQLIAIGASTADALKSAGLSNIRYREGQTNSERLLQISELQEDKIKDKKILILSGKGGRETLADLLTERAAKLATLALYERRRPCYDSDQIKAIWSQLPDVIVLTSIEATENLVATLQATEFYDQLLATRIVALSKRIGLRIKELGFSNTIAIAQTTDNSGLIKALHSCFEEVQRERKY